MRWQQVEAGLELAFGGPAREVGRSLVVERAEPFRLTSAMTAAMTVEERDEHGDLEDWPGSVPGLLEANGVDRVLLLGFYWDGFGPTSWLAGLELIGRGSRRYLCVWDEAESYRAVASLDPWDDPVALSSTVARLIARNGAHVGTVLFGGLPHETTNYASSLLPRDVVRQSYFDLIQHWQRERRDAWATFAEEHFGRIVEPNHLTRCLDMLATLPPLNDPDALGLWNAQRIAESEAIPDHARQLLFDQWFAAAYEEPEHEAAA